MQAWQKLGCFFFWWLPFISAGFMGFYFSLDQLRRGDVELTSLLLLASVCFVGLPLALVFLRFPRKGMPPAAETVRPQPDNRTMQPRPATAAVQPGRIAGTRVRVEEWVPGRVIRVRQDRTWQVWTIVMAALVVAGVMVVIPSLESGFLRVGMPNRAGLLVFGAWPFLGFVWASLPSLPREVEIDWSAGAIRTRYGRVRRELGLARVRGIARHEVISGGGDKEQVRRRHRRGIQLIVWIEPDAQAPVPYLLIETDNVKATTIDAFDELAEALAAALGVLDGRPENGGDPTHAHV